MLLRLQKTFTRGGIFIRRASFFQEASDHLFGCLRASCCCINQGLFISLCAQEFLYYTHTHPPLQAPLRPAIYLASLPRPYTQHASQSHSEFCACFSAAPRHLHPLFPSSPRQFKQGRVQRPQRGAKSLCRVSIWPRFRWIAHTRTHTHHRTLKGDRAGKHAHASFHIRRPSCSRNPF